MLGQRGDVVLEGEAFNDALLVAQQFVVQRSAIFIPKGSLLAKAERWKFEAKIVPNE